MADKFILGFPISDKTADSVLYQDGSNVGIGVADPDAKFHVSNGASGFSGSYNARTSAVFENSLSNGCTISIMGKSTGYSGIFFGDEDTEPTGQLTYSHTDNSFRFSNNGGTERMRITSDGRVFFSGLTSSEAGIASNGIEASCDSANAFTAAFNQKNTGSYATLALSHAHTSGTEKFMWFYVNNYSGSGVGSISTNGTSTSYNTTSDYRLKENVVDITGALNRLDSLSPRRFNFISDDTTTVDGFIAHEVQTVVPEAVLGTQDEVDDDGNAVYQGIDQSKLVPLLTAALQEAHTIIKDLKSRVETLENA